MAQKLAARIAFLLGKQEHFRIKFRQYDGADQVYFPTYSSAIGLAVGDLVAFAWGDGDIRFGVIKELRGKGAEIHILARRKPIKTHAYILKERILTVFIPE